LEYSQGLSITLPEKSFCLNLDNGLSVAQTAGLRFQYLGCVSQLS
jgi:hypothetical protein